MKKKEVYGCIYLIKNKANGKCYVGQHKNVETVKRRWQSHISVATRRGCMPRGLVARAIRKAFSQDKCLKSFEASVIWQGSLDQINAKEVYYIKKFHSFVDDPLGGGYNLTTGGELVKKMSKASREKLSKSRKAYFINTPGAHEKASQISRQRFEEDPALCDVMSVQIKKYWAETPGARAAQSRHAKKQWSSEEARQAMSALKLTQYEDPALRKRVREATKLRFTKPGACEASRAVSLKYNAEHPEKGAKHSAFYKKHCAEHPEVVAKRVEEMRIASINRSFADRSAATLKGWENRRRRQLEDLEAA